MMLCIVQARMSSRRLPGKAMLDVHGRVLLGRVVDRLKQAERLSRIVVATSDRDDDQPLADFCAGEDIQCVRGPLNDVARRFRQVVEHEGADAFVRISGDSPLIDPVLVDLAVSYFQQGECDLVTNVQPRTFPKGQSVEVLLSEPFIRACEVMTTDSQREHVTRIYYEHPAAYRTLSFTSGMAFGQINLSVDTPEDAVVIEAILERMGNRPGGWREVSTAYQEVVAT
jgi:spore coat polysaccharide biosynthesis protein SpsF (cytidylyltransferase family)